MNLKKVLSRFSKRERNQSSSNTWGNEKLSEVFCCESLFISNNQLDLRWEPFSQWLVYVLDLKRLGNPQCLWRVFQNAERFGETLSSPSGLLTCPTVFQMRTETDWKDSAVVWWKPFLLHLLKLLPRCFGSSKIKPHPLQQMLKLATEQVHQRATLFNAKIKAGRVL